MTFLTDLPSGKSQLCPFLGGLLTAISFSLLRVFCTGIGIIALAVIGVLEFHDPPATPEPIAHIETPPTKTKEGEAFDTSEPMDAFAKFIEDEAPFAMNQSDLGDTADTSSVGVYETVAERRLNEFILIRTADPRWKTRERIVRDCMALRFVRSSNTYEMVSDQCEEYYKDR